LASASISRLGDFEVIGKVEGILESSGISPPPKSMTVVVVGGMVQFANRI
jgi:hypothetical protein